MFAGRNKNGLSLNEQPSQGRHTAVVILIEDWNNLAQTYKGLKDLESPYKSEQAFEEKLYLLSMYVKSEQASLNDNELKQ